MVVRRGRSVNGKWCDKIQNTEVFISVVLHNIYTLGRTCGLHARPQATKKKHCPENFRKVSGPKEARRSISNKAFNVNYVTWENTAMNMEKWISDVNSKQKCYSRLTQAD